MLVTNEQLNDTGNDKIESLPYSIRTQANNPYS